MSLKYIPHYEFYNDGTANLVLFSFLSSEVVNVACWINFISHLRTCVRNIGNNCDIKNIKIHILFNKMKFRELISTIIIALIGACYIIWNIFIIIYSLIDPQCKDCQPFNKHTDEDCGSYCTTTLDFFNYTILLLVSFGFFIILIKLIVGGFLLYYLKYHMITYFKKNYLLIIFTIICSCAIISNRSTYYLVEDYRECDLKYNFAAKSTFPLWQAPIQIFLTSFDILCPIGICLLNIKAINFEKYLTELMKACQLEKYIAKASIFIMNNEAYEINIK